MVRKFKGVVIAALAMSTVLAGNAYADGILYAPGVQGNTETQGPSTSGSSTDTSSSSGTDTPGTAAAGSTASASGSAASGSTGTGSTAASGTASNSGLYTTVTTNTTSSSTIGPGVTTVQQTTAVTLGSAGETAVTDPVLGKMPSAVAVMIHGDGTTDAPIYTTQGKVSASKEGFNGLWASYGDAVGDLYYRVYTDEHGWSKWAMNEMRTDTSTGSARVTAVQMRTTGHTANIYDIYYKVTLNDGTELGWAHNGEAAGTFGTGKYIQSMEIKLFKKGTATAAGYQLASNYEGVVRGDDGKARYSTFDGRSFTGWAYDTDGNKYYFKDNNIVTGWQYIDGYKYYFDDNGVVVTDLEPIIGLKNDYILRLNKDMKTLTVYTKDGDNGYILPVKAILTTVGNDTPIGTFKTYESYRWKYMHAAEGGAIYCQYLLRFKNGFILHSIIYQGAADSYHLVADTYNQIGKNKSDGCVRMLSGDAAWVYNNCGVGTQITIYNDAWVTGPFDRPAVQQAIPTTQNYDPTDPVIVQKQKAEADAAAKAAAAAAAEAAAQAESEAAAGTNEEPNA